MTTPISLTPHAYWRLRYFQAVAEKAEAMAALRWAEYREQSMRHGIDPLVPLQWHDATCSLVPATDTPPAGASK